MALQEWGILSHYHLEASKEHRKILPCAPVVHVSLVIHVYSSHSLASIISWKNSLIKVWVSLPISCHHDVLWKYPKCSLFHIYLFHYLNVYTLLLDLYVCKLAHAGNSDVSSYSIQNISMWYNTQMNNVYYEIKVEMKCCCLMLNSLPQDGTQGIPISFLPFLPYCVQAFDYRWKNQP